MWARAAKATGNFTGLPRPDKLWHNTGAGAVARLIQLTGKEPEPMTKQALNITNETEADDLVVLDKEQMVVIRNMVENIYSQMDLLRDLMKAAGVPAYSFERQNTVKAYRSQLHGVVERAIEKS